LRRGLNSFAPTGLPQSATSKETGARTTHDPDAGTTVGLLNATSSHHSAFIIQHFPLTAPPASLP
jgi:hypothetical protein